MTDTIAQLLKKELSGKKLIIVSNREPYVHKKTGLSVRAEQPAGGLTSAMDDVLRATGGIWVAWGSGSGDKDTVDVRNRVPVPPGNPAYILKRVWLSPGEVENYYHGYSNQVLWPLCHITLDRVYFRRKFWDDYVTANRAFAEAVVEESDEQSVAWIHDYHLCLAPRFIRHKKKNLTLAHFWHIPWPDWSVFRICPQAREILEGLLGNDMIAFQIPLFARNFLVCVQECLGAGIDYHHSTVTYRGHVTKLKAFPISIDFSKFSAMASSPRTEAAMRDILALHHLPPAVGLGVDRLEYTKALIKRLQAIALLFERYEKLRGKFTFIQIAVPTRLKEPYLSYRETVEKLVAGINAKFGKGLWKPIVYIDTKVEHRDLVAYYRLADVAVISSIYDGMNLVAKEYAASQIEEKGTLILSEFAGAADELQGAILVNPYDVEEFASSIKKALQLPGREKKRLMSALRKQVRENDIYRWIRDILGEIVLMAERRKKGPRYFFDHQHAIGKLLYPDKFFLFLDFDGTLAPISKSPEQACLSAEIRELVARLAEKVPVAIVSGRGIEDVQQRVGIDNLIYAGNHGAEIRSRGKTLINHQSQRDRRLLEELLERLRSALSSISGVIIEDKGVTGSVHYRLIDLKRLADFSARFSAVAREYEKTFRITSGKKVFEIRPLHAWHKGDAVSWILEHLAPGKTGVYIGDDTTDEDAFKVLKGRGLSIAVGGSIHADFAIRKQSEIGSVLGQLLAMTGGGNPLPPGPFPVPARRRSTGSAIDERGAR